MFEIYQLCEFLKKYVSEEDANDFLILLILNADDNSLTDEGDLDVEEVVNNTFVDIIDEMTYAEEEQREYLQRMFKVYEIAKAHLISRGGSDVKHTA
jgi:hypothetical protein